MDTKLPIESRKHCDWPATTLRDSAQRFGRILEKPAAHAKASTAKKTNAGIK
jgi:hypothetical protein